MAKQDSPEELKRKEVEADLLQRRADAQAEYQKFEPDFREAYTFQMPHRVQIGTDTQTRPQSSDTFTTLGEEVTTDFASDMADTFTPEHLQWAESEPAAIIPDEIKQEVADAVKRENDITFDAIRSSGFHEACKMGNKDLAVSAFALAIEDDGGAEPIRCQVIPIPELRMLRGFKGGIDTRLWVRSRTAREIKALFPELALPADVEKAIKDKSKAKFEIVQGCYRDYSVKAETAWIICTMISKKLLAWNRKVGVGSANIIPCRWDPDPTFAWGNGPGIKALGDFRELDETAYLKMKGMARQVDPAITYDDDSIINMDDGLPNGVAIPRAVGSKIDILESTHPIDIAFYATKDVEDRVRRHFYLDEPRQEGKTPPTLGQWMDESIRRQRRLGTPASPIWPEFLFEVFMRFRFLLIARGELDKELKVGGRLIPIRPVNPLKRAAQQEEAAASLRYLESMGALFGPELLQVAVDVGETWHKIKDQSHATGVKLQTKEKINKGVAAMMTAGLAEKAAAAAGPVLAAAGKQ